MKRNAILAAILILVNTAAWAESSKFAAQASRVVLIPRTSDDDREHWRTVLSAEVHTPNHKELLIGASLETGVLTATGVSSRKGGWNLQAAAAQVEVRIVVDPEAPGTGDPTTVPVYPHRVVYDRQIQVLNSALGGVIRACADVDDNGIIVVADECRVTDEEVGLILASLGARHFNFLAPDLVAGNHVVEVQVRLNSRSTGHAIALAGVGRGTLTVEEVQSANSENGIVIDMNP